MSLQHLCNSECSLYCSWTPNPPALPYIRQTQQLWPPWRRGLPPTPRSFPLQSLRILWVLPFSGSLHCIWDAVLQEVTWLDLRALLSLLSASSLCSNVVSYIRPLLSTFLKHALSPRAFSLPDFFSLCVICHSLINFIIKYLFLSPFLAHELKEGRDFCWFCLLTPNGCSRWTSYVRVDLY